VSSAQLGSREDVESWIESSAIEDTRAAQAEAADREAVEAARVARERLLAEVAALPAMPGVYRYFDVAGTVLYVGKARNLRARVTNYARASGHSGRIARMIHETASMMVLTTRTETEALLLEQNRNDGGVPQQ
jgi:hypothetical protein